MVILENIDMVILENIDIDIGVDMVILENIDIDIYRYELSWKYQY